MPNLVISTSVEQTEEASFNFEFALFDYPIIWLLHYGKGALLCHISPDIGPANVKISKHSDTLCVIISNTLIFIANVFEPVKPADNAYHHKLKLVFSREHSISVNAMKEHYLSVAGNTNDGHMIIPLPALG
ncbi:hypothetical protein [Candidatus Fukatsuia endosymbiont of Tuberolachnus salignus]|uniref:hypothetical protein n=1 Tax=Candidatus Fukatsuia endosymbiont of Tuberolachnus salignus TaxID=3077957 RepID=UPI00313C228C